MMSYSTLAFAQTFDGYMWAELSPDNKLLFLSGFLRGYMKGERRGFFEGRTSFVEQMQKAGLKWSKNELEKEAKISSKEATQIKEKIMKIQLDTALEIINSLAGRDNKYNLLQNDVTYYVKETDSFLKTFPLCKGKDISTLFSSLIDVWLKDETTSYKKIGEWCLE
jgi:hypothetical protein